MIRDEISSGEAAVLIAFASDYATANLRYSMRSRLGFWALRIADGIEGKDKSPDIQGEVEQFRATAQLFLCK
jgi:hypothetical protein